MVQFFRVFFLVLVGAAVVFALFFAGVVALLFVAGLVVISSIVFRILSWRRSGKVVYARREKTTASQGGKVIETEYREVGKEE